MKTEKSDTAIRQARRMQKLKEWDNKLGGEMRVLTLLNKYYKTLEASHYNLETVQDIAKVLVRFKCATRAKGCVYPGYVLAKYYDRVGMMEYYASIRKSLLTD